mmetsp:Transcript_72481/g.161065  ORF Transcript_72481/g.161065 Transcript_72481/m.161065 type:complete len:389 (-) Transcript_72481:10-1176(-)
MSVTSRCSKAVTPSNSTRANGEAQRVSFCDFICASSGDRVCRRISPLGARHARRHIAYAAPEEDASTHSHMLTHTCGRRTRSCGRGNQGVLVGRAYGWRGQSEAATGTPNCPPRVNCTSEQGAARTLRTACPSEFVQRQLNHGPTCDPRRSTCDLRRSTCDPRRSTCDLRRSTCDLRRSQAISSISPDSTPAPRRWSVAAGLYVERLRGLTNSLSSDKLGVSSGSGGLRTGALPSSSSSGGGGSRAAHIPEARPSLSPSVSSNAVRYAPRLMSVSPLPSMLCGASNSRAAPVFSSTGSTVSSCASSCSTRLSRAAPDEAGHPAPPVPSAATPSSVVGAVGGAFSAAAAWSCASSARSSASSASTALTPVSISSVTYLYSDLFRASFSR